MLPLSVQAGSKALPIPKLVGDTTATKTKKIVAATSVVLVVGFAALILTRRRPSSLPNDYRW